MLPALFVSTRLAQYLKVVLREVVGTWKSREEVLEGLSSWFDGLVQHGSPGDSPAPGPYRLRTRHPLRSFALRIDEAPPEAASIPFELRIQPNWSASGRFFTLAITGRLERE